jgi:MFS family permease
VNSLPSKQELLAFQDRWVRFAGMVAILGSLIFAAGVVVQQVGLESADTDVEQLDNFHDHATQLIAGQVLQGLGFALFAVTIYVLFRAASGRAERMRRSLLPLALIGPPLFLIAMILVSFGVRDIADQFVEERPAIEQQARQEAAAAQAPAEETPDETVENALEDRAEDLGQDSSIIQIGSGLRVTATLAIAFALIYTPLWAMRTGLLTRFWASLGMALGAALLLLGVFGLMGLVLWFAAIGLQLAGWWPRPRPPAWEAGVAIPWPRPGEEPESLGAPPPSGTVEGSGREIAEPPLPEDQIEEPGRETQGERRKKRKRRQ